MKRICVFCGSRQGTDPAYRQAATELGAQIASSGIELVYGGGSRGLMGTMADAALNLGGRVIGVVPDTLFAQEHVHTRLTDLRVVKTLLDRKALMAELSDGFITLPGGIGTMDELFEMWTWLQLGIHTKPCGILNVKGYYDTLLNLIDAMVKRGFLAVEQRNKLLVHDDPEALLHALRSWCRTSSPEPFTGNMRRSGIKTLAN